MPSLPRFPTHARLHLHRPRTLTVLLGLLAACTAAALAAGQTAHTSAQARPQVRTETIHLQVPVGNETYGVSIELLLVDDGTGSFERQAAASRQAILQRFPEAIAPAPGSIHSQFVKTGFWWPSRTTSWAYNASGKPSWLSNETPSMLASANAWNNAGGAVWSFTGGGSTSAGTGACGDSSGLDDKNTVGWAAQSSNTLAVTCSWYSTSATPYTAIEFDMEIDPDWNWTTSNTGVQIDLQSVITHEFGHALGLNHSQSGQCPGPVMCATYSDGTLNRTLTADDLAGIIALYGAGNATATATRTPTVTATATTTATATATATSTPLGTATSCARTGCGGTATATRTPTATATATATQTTTRTPTATATSCPRGRCPTGSTATATTTATTTATATATQTQTATATACPRRSSC